MRLPSGIVLPPQGYYGRDFSDQRIDQLNKWLVSGEPLSILVVWMRHATCIYTPTLTRHSQILSRGYGLAERI